MAVVGDVYTSTTCGCTFRLTRHEGGGNWETLVIKAGDCGAADGEKVFVSLFLPSYVRIEPPAPAAGDVYAQDCGCEAKLLSPVGNSRAWWDAELTQAAPQCQDLAWKAGYKFSLDLDGDGWEPVVTTVKPPTSPAPGQLWRLTCGCVVRLCEQWMSDWSCDQVLACKDAHKENPIHHVGPGILSRSALWDDGAGLPTPRPEADGDTTVYASSPAPAPDDLAAPPRLEKVLDAAKCYQCPAEASWYTRSRVPLCNLCARELLQEQAAP